MAKVTRPEPQPPDKPEAKPQPDQQTEAAKKESWEPTDRVDRVQLALLADIRTLLKHVYNQLLMIRMSQPPPVDDRLVRWEEWGKIMDGRGGIKAKPRAPIPAEPQPAPLPVAPAASAPAPAAPQMIGDVDASFMTDRARARLEAASNETLF